MIKRYLKLMLFLLCDFISALLSVCFSLLLCGESAFNFGSTLTLLAYTVLPFTVLIVFYLLKIYNILWRYSNIGEFIRIPVACVVSTAILIVTQTAICDNHFEPPAYFLIVFIMICMVISQRTLTRKIINESAKSKKSVENDDPDAVSGNIMIIGAGSAGQMIINEMYRKKEYINCKIKCVIDDDFYKHGQYISGVKIIGGRNMIIEAARKFDISLIVFAIPNCKNSEKSAILDICQETGCKLRIIPSVCKMYNLSELTPTIRKVEIEDLLGRDPIEINMGDDLNYVDNKVVLVTGGGGTIGSELCRQIAYHNPKRLIIFDIYENNAYEIQHELTHNFPKLDLVTLIGSVRDSSRMDYIFRTYKPQIIYHAAAHKHVPLMEDSPNESIKNNVFGTLKTAECADKYGAEKFVLISTDKAVNPTNIMGASKRICEMIVQSFNKRSDTDFVAVRFGNVLGSNGSVIPLFKKQIKMGGPVTVTDPNIIRYFMTIPEAVSLVLRAGANAKGGEIFVLDMGEPVRILDLAENLIKLSGFKPYEDIKIEFTGLRPGEKLYEELLMSEEGLEATENSLIHIGKPIEMDEDTFIETLDKMKEAMYDERNDIRTLVKNIVPTYIPENAPHSKYDSAVFKG